MTKRQGKQVRRTVSSTPFKAVKWMAVFGVAALIVYGASQMSGVAFDEDAIRVVSFSGLTASEKQSALKAANRARCDCGCGLTLAECVATDSTCPIRESNIDRVKAMVREAGRALP